MPTLQAALNLVTVFVASPEDVATEREILARVIRELNATLEALDLPLRLHLRRWEEHCTPAAGEPQGVIFGQIGDYDVFVGIMWRRFGTPIRDAGSGTEAEYLLAYGEWRKRGEPRVMFYFSRAPASTRSTAEAQQVLRVLQFKKRISRQTFYAEFDGPSDFETQIRRHLNTVLGKFWKDLKKQNEVVTDAKRGIREAVDSMPPPPVRPDDHPSELRLSAAEVEALRVLIRTTHPNGPPEDGPWAH